MPGVMSVKSLPPDRSMHMAARLAQTIAVCLVAAWMPGCIGQGYEAFVRSHDSIRVGMTLGEVFRAGLADYLIDEGSKNVPGATLPERQPASGDCTRHVLDIHYVADGWSTGSFNVRVYCGMNDPAAKQVLPGAKFTDKAELFRALDTVYASWGKSMNFRVESPPREIIGVYDHYEFTTDREGKVATVSPIILSPSRRGR